MPAAINAASLTPSDAPGARATAGSTGRSAAPGPRGREFSEVLRDTSAKSRAEKANAASEDERPVGKRTEGAANRPGTETAQPTGDGKAQGEVEVNQASDARAAEAAPQAGNELPPSLNVVAEPLPVTGAPAAAAAANSSMPFAVAAAVRDTAATATSHASIGRVPTTLETALTGSDAPVAQGGGRPAAAAPSGSTARIGVAIGQVHPHAAATGDAGHGAELAAIAAGDTGAAADRTAAATTRFDTALALAQTSAGSTTTAQVGQAPTTAAASTSIPLPINHPHWQEAFASRVAWQVRDGLQQVSVAINPPELGPIEVRMSLQDDKVSAQFVTAHHAVRQVIEDAMPRLREMLSQSGLNLADANVFQHAPGRDGQAQQFAGGAAAGNQEPAGGEEEVTSPAIRTLRVGLVDAYV
ncbi:MAG: hypothetical protein NFCOHLIN_00452 [Gammaproteobacteria bacterium]|nr:hypothetical protein [Gammaproteobacteria bacterium]